MSEVRRQVAPAGPRAAAAELTRLVAVYRISPQQWRDMSIHYVEALAHLPADVLHDAVTRLIGAAKSGDYFPRPGDVLELCREDMAARLAMVEHVREAHETWPKWLTELWGPLPDGPRKRAAAISEVDRDRS